jgi:hypothetical protein
MSRLLFELGNDSKAADEKMSGGSFGFGGKSVFLNAGRHSIVLAYSVFDSKFDHDRGAFAQLMGAGYFERHEVAGRHFDGFAEFVKLTSEGIHREPWTNEEAQALALGLGFTPRTVQDTGTSVLLLGASTSLDHIRTAVEKWWWPRIVSNELDVKLFDGSGEVEPPKPKSRAFLRPFISCFQAIGSGDSEEVKTAEIRLADRSMGSLSLRLNTTAGDGEEEDEEYSATLRGVALVRSPRMVVEYHLGWATGRIPEACQGVFLADDGIDNLLRFSENAPHTVWDPRTPRLLREYPLDAPLVAALLKDIRKRARAFAAQATPPAPSTGFRVPILEDFLAEALRTGRKGGANSDNRVLPVHIRNVEPTKTLERDGVYLTGAPVLELYSSSDPLRARVLVDCRPLEEGGAARTDSIPVRFQHPDPAFKVEGASVTLDLTPGVPVTLEYVAGPSDPEWSVAITLNVEPVHNEMSR